MSQGKGALFLWLLALASNLSVALNGALQWFTDTNFYFKQATRIIKLVPGAQATEFMEIWLFTETATQGSLGLGQAQSLA